MFGASVPEAAIYEDRNTIPAKNKVGPSENRLMSPPACNAMSA
jgi:hypothetical protein